MNEQLKLLVELQALDTKIIEKDRTTASAPDKISSFEKKIQSVATAFERRKEKLGSAKKKLKENERELDDIDERINKLKSRSTDIKTNKEYQALMSEIEGAERERYEHENGMLALMEKVEGENGLITDEEARAASEKSAVEAEMKQFEGEVAAMKKEIAALNEKRHGLKAAIDEDTYEQYMEALDSAGGLAVVAASGEICQGCNMHIPPQQFVEVRKNEEIIHCQQCRRILYYTDDVPETE